MGHIVERARALRKRIEGLAVEHVDDKDAADCAELFPAWDGGGRGYKAGERVRYAGVVFKVLQDHTSQPGWNPEHASSLFTKALIFDPDVIPVWEQPGSENAYMVGDRVHYPAEDGPVYESVIDNNVWPPGNYPEGWREVRV